MEETAPGSEFGTLILQAIPSKEIEELVISYLSRMVKNVPAEKLSQRVKITPYVLSKNIAVKKGEKIAQNLRALGARAEFVPHNPMAQSPARISETQLPLEIESLHSKSETKLSQQHTRSGTPGSGKHLITAIVVIILIAVFSLLTWQLYHLVTEKIFN